MKRFNKILLGLALLAFAVSCEETEFETTGENLGNFVSFSTGAASVNENSGSTTADGTSTVSGSNYVIRILRSTTDLSQPLTVNISSSITFATTSDFANAGDDASSTVLFSSSINTVEIPAGEAEANVTFSTINDDFSAGDKSVILTITGTSDASYALGAPQAAIGNTLAITVVDDDCPIDIASFEGEYTMTVVGTPGAPFDGFDLCASAARDCSGVVTLAADPSDPLGQTAILTHPSFGGEYKIQFITCPLETAVVQPMTSFFGVGAWQMQQGSIPGNYNEDSKDISIVGVLGTNGDFTINLKKTN